MPTCYLDSQDYSVLCDPQRQSPEIRQLKSDLLHLRRSNQVEFAYSAIVISEVVALTPEATHLAALKADLVAELCGANALMSMDRLVVSEVRALASGSGPLATMIDSNGQWFPSIDLGDERPKADSIWERINDVINDELGSMGMSRQARRAHARKFVKNGQPKAALRAHVESADPRALGEQLREQFPMAPEHALTIGRYALGLASEEEFDAALWQSLMNPSFIMKWFASNHAMSSPVAELIRAPGRELGMKFRELIGVSKGWAKLLAENESDVSPTGRHGQITKLWHDEQAAQLLRLVQRIANRDGLSVDTVCLEEVVRTCPGLTTAINSLYSSAWASVGGGRKEALSDSQPVDALHALYAPYVDVFRADRFMAPHIQAEAKRYGTVVESRLLQLTATLRSLIQ